MDRLDGRMDGRSEQNGAGNGESWGTREPGQRGMGNGRFA